MQNIDLLIVGRSTIAKELEKIYPESTVVGRAEYDLTVQGHCDKLVQDYMPRKVAITHGVNHGDLWDMMQVNFTSAVYLIAKFYEKMDTGQIVIVGSATTSWQSWPGIDMDRMVYSTTKAGIREYCANLNRKNLPADAEKNVSVQLYEPNSFFSPMSNYSTKTPAHVAAQELSMLIENPRLSILQGLNR